ncbi:THUMP domain-containing protein [Candidatus Bathyarchaeota archaeon]|nr:THUMP domain-containing protein [Candidatus Bathyarchaeota archaeon]MBL7079297.1 THUMP domain-containing protein [Candidatus Bathyarchaeota archaeon]
MSALIDAPDLLATSDIWSTSAACSELWMLLRAVGDETPSIYRTRVKGLIAAETSLEPLEAIRRMRGELQERPESFKNLLRIIPVEATVPTEIGEIVETAQRLAEKIPGDESFRVTLEKRRTELRSREVIDAVAERIDRKVDLGEPDWVVLVEIVGKRTGVAVVPPDGILSVQKERALLSSEGE